MQNIFCSILYSNTPTNCKPRGVLTPENADATWKNSFDDIFDNQNVSDDNVADIEQHAGTDNLKFNKENSNASNKNFIK